MDIIRLRTMTMKSKFNEGKYAGLTVEQVFNLGKWKLAYIYYNYPRISFTDDILELIGIKEDRRIEKPGKNPDMFNKIMRRVVNKATNGKAGFIEYHFKRRVAKKRLKHIEDEEQFTKGQMQYQNVHGSWRR